MLQLRLMTHPVLLRFSYNIHVVPFTLSWYSLAELKKKHYFWRSSIVFINCFGPMFYLHPKCFWRKKKELNSWLFKVSNLKLLRCRLHMFNCMQNINKKKNWINMDFLDRCQICSKYCTWTCTCISGNGIESGFQLSMATRLANFN